MTLERAHNPSRGAHQLSALLLSLCGLYALHLSAQVWWALEPQVASHGLTYDYPPPIKLKSGEALLEPRRVSLSRELRRRYAISERLETLLSAEGARLSLTSLERLFTSEGLELSTRPLTDDATLPLIITPPAPSHLSQRFNPKATSASATLIIARYGGMWVWFEPSLGVALGELPLTWRGAEGLSVRAWRERRW